VSNYKSKKSKSNRRSKSSHSSKKSQKTNRSKQQGDTPTHVSVRGGSQQESSRQSQQFQPYQHHKEPPQYHQHERQQERYYGPAHQQERFYNPAHDGDNSTIYTSTRIMSSRLYRHRLQLGDRIMQAEGTATMCESIRLLTLTMCESIRILTLILMRSYRLHPLKIASGVSNPLVIYSKQSVSTVCVAVRSFFLECFCTVSSQ
jgi:hypothetical protein